MRKYTLSAAAASDHIPEHPERTARRFLGGSASLNFDVQFQVWPSRAAMLATIRMQQRRAPDSRDWRAVKVRDSDTLCSICRRWHGPEVTHACE